MPEITAQIGTLRFVVDMFARRQDVHAETVITLTQDVLDATERELRTARDMTSKFEGLSIGFKKLEP